VAGGVQKGPHPALMSNGEDLRKGIGLADRRSVGTLVWPGGKE